MKIWESIKTPLGLQLPKWEPTWECVESFFHIFLHSYEHEMWLSGFTLGLHLCKPLLWSRAQGWSCDIFNLMFFSLGVLLKTTSVPLCFTNLCFTRNNQCYLRHYVAYKSLFYLKNSSRCFKLLIYTIFIQIIVNGIAIFHLFM